MSIIPSSFLAGAHHSVRYVYMHIMSGDDPQVGGTMSQLLKVEHPRRGESSKLKDQGWFWVETVREKGCSGAEAKGTARRKNTSQKQ